MGDCTAPAVLRAWLAARESQGHCCKRAVAPERDPGPSLHLRPRLPVSGSGEQQSGNQPNREGVGPDLPLSCKIWSWHSKKLTPSDPDHRTLLHPGAVCFLGLLIPEQFLTERHVCELTYIQR